MKRFFGYVAFTCVLFIGLGAVVDKAAARFKSDAKALEVIAKARQAIGGDAAIAEIRSLSIKGQTTTMRTIDGMARTDQGETEIAIQLPNQMMKMVKIGKGDGVAGSAMKMHNVTVIRTGDGTIVDGKDGEFTTSDGKTFDVKIAPGSGEVTETVTPDGKKIVVRRAEGANAAVWKTEGGETVDVEDVEKEFKHVALAGEHAGTRNNELLRTMLGLLVTAPEGMDVSYTFVGEGNIDGTSVNTVDASFAGATYRLHFDRSTNVPVGMSYKGHAPVVMQFNRDGEAPVDGDKKVMVFTTKMDAHMAVESFVRFGGFRSTNGVQLPYKWTTSVSGQTTEIFDVVSYEVNPANIAERFNNQNVKIRIAKPAEIK